MILFYVSDQLSDFASYRISIEFLRVCSIVCTHGNTVDQNNEQSLLGSFFSWITVAKRDRFFIQPGEYFNFDANMQRSGFSNFCFDAYC